MNILLLEEILSKREPKILDIIKGENLNKIDESNGYQVRSILTDELLETGMDDNDKVNERGLAIEKLIDDVGRIYMD